MKKIFKILLFSLFMLTSPIISEAATFTLKEVEKKDNVALYDVVYSPEDTPVKEVKLDLTKTNNNLTYVVAKNENSGAVGSCSEFPCPLSLDLVTSTSTTIATISITNSTESEQTTILTLSGDVKSDPVTLTLKAMPTTTTTTTTTAKVLSTEATLSSINLSVGSMEQAFASDIMEYTVTGIKDTVNSVTITPNCDNNCSWTVTCPTGGCSVTNTRRVTLETGPNKVAVNVTSEDGASNKTYILNIYRGEIVASSAYLSELKINDGTISPNFESLTNDYSITVGLDVEQLDIITTTEDPSAQVLIKGNEKLVEGENTITITVTSSDGENKQVYTILVNKQELEEEKEEEAKKEVITKPVEKKKNYTWLIILLSVLGLGLIITIFLIIFKRKKNKKNSNDKNNKPGSTQIKELPEDKNEELKNEIEKENTESLNILNETRKSMYDEPKQDIDAALDDLMQTKRLELGDLDF